MNLKLNLEPYKWHIISKGDGGNIEFANKLNALLDEIKDVSQLGVLQRTVEAIYDNDDIRKIIKEYYERL